MGDYKQVKMYPKNHAKLEEARQLEKQHSYHSWDTSYNNMVGFLSDFYIQFHAEGGRVRDIGSYRKAGSPRCEISYPPPIQGPSREEMGHPIRLRQ